MCVDLSHLNKHVMHEHYQSSTPAQAVIEIAASKAIIFTVPDILTTSTPWISKANP